MESKVLQVINTSGLGGAETVVQKLLINEKHPVFCLKKDNIERFTLVSKDVYFGTISNNYKLNPFIFFKLIKLVKQKEIDVLHVHLANSLFYAILIKVFISNTKIIYHEHGEIFYNNKLKLMIKIFQNNINLYIAVSKVTKQKLMEHINISEDKIKVLYNFVDLDELNGNDIKSDLQKNRDKLGIKEEEFVIGYVGRLSYIKGCEYLISALQYLDFKYKCLILGDGELRAELETLADDLNVAEYVKFLGYKQDIASYYSLFDILVMPSLSEASPMTFYESQAYGIPIVGSDISAIKELVTPKKNGLLFEVKNSKDLATKISYLYDSNKLRIQIKEYSLQNINNYSLEAYIKNLNFIYSSL
ncbi:glycosyl transferase, group 1 [Methanolobus psychrophilus R15]|nr:glycosyl transferase, group 1 [Methanolobus psychrophilus R15]